MEEKVVQLILRQTDYTEEIAREKLLENNYDPILVIKKYMGLEQQKQEPIKSVNQEIYKQLRYKLDSSMREYSSKKDKCEK
jgi:hypothetical protein